MRHAARPAGERFRGGPRIGRGATPKAPPEPARWRRGGPPDEAEEVAGLLRGIGRPARPRLTWAEIEGWYARPELEPLVPACDCEEHLATLEEALA